MTFLTILGVTGIFCGFRLVLEWKASRKITELSRYQFLGKFSSNSFVLTDAELQGHVTL